MRDSSRGVGFTFLLAVLLIYPLPQMAIDLYLPSWPSMLLGLNTTKYLLQYSLIIYILALGIAQLIYGPLSDSLGRKPILLFGIGLFFISSLGCLFTASIHTFLTLRALQGLGIGCGFTVASAILADTFEGEALAKMTSYSAMIYSLSLILSPFIGSYLQHYIGWKANFTLMVVYSVFLFLMIFCFVHETRLEKSTAQLKFPLILRKYYSLIFKKKFIGFVSCLILAYGVMVTFNIIAPFLLQQNFHVSTIHYGRLILLVGLAYFIGATINSRLIKYINIHQLIFLGLFLMVLSGVGLLFSALEGWMNTVSVIIFVSLALLSLGFIYPNCFACALNLCSDKGYASAFIGSAILIGVSLISGVVSHFNVDHELCLSIAFLILAMLSILSYLMTFLSKVEE